MLSFLSCNNSVSSMTYTEAGKDDFFTPKRSTGERVGKECGFNWVKFSEWVIFLDVRLFHFRKILLRK